VCGFRWEGIVSLLQNRPLSSPPISYSIIETTPQKPTHHNRNKNKAKTKNSLLYFFSTEVIILDLEFDAMAITGDSHSQFHVLAVDDSMIDRKLIERLLKTSSYQGTKFTFLVKKGMIFMTRVVTVFFFVLMFCKVSFFFFPGF